MALMPNKPGIIIMPAPELVETIDKLTQAIERGIALGLQWTVSEEQVIRYMSEKDLEYIGGHLVTRTHDPIPL